MNGITEQMHEMLKELEWSFETNGYYGLCPVCLASEKEGHSEDCRLATLTKAAEAVREGQRPSVWAIIIVDRHSDPEVKLFRSEENAVDQARAMAAARSLRWKAEYPDSWAEYNTPEDAARYCWTYSPEGDYIIVKEIDDPS